MNVLVSSNNKFLKPLVTSLYSLALNTNERSINVYFINVSVDKKKLKWLLKIIKKIKKINIIIINIDIGILSNLKLKNHFSVETYSRLLLTKVLPKKMDRILWLDADTIIHNNIDELYCMDLEGYSMLACKSINQNDMEIRKNLKLDDNQLYFNAGIILFNLEYIRNNFNDDFLIDYAIKNNGSLKWLDQDVLNAQLGKTAKIIDYKKYNYMHFNGTNFSSEEKEYISNSNCIIHYIGAVKPWHYKYTCYTFSFWKKYAMKSGVYSKLFFVKNAFFHNLYVTYGKILKNRGAF